MNIILLSSSSTVRAINWKFIGRSSILFSDIFSILIGGGVTNGGQGLLNPQNP